jgi:hypothetical protein
MKYPRFPMIDPDNRVIVSHLTLAASWPTSDGKRAATSLPIRLPSEAGQLAVAQRRRPGVRRLRHIAASYSGETYFPLQKWPGRLFPDAAGKADGRVAVSASMRAPEMGGCRTAKPMVAGRAARAARASLSRRMPSVRQPASARRAPDFML